MKFLKFIPFVTICLITLTFRYITASHVIYSSEISEDGYGVKIKQERGSSLIRRYAYLDVDVKDRSIITSKILFSGDLLDRSFDERYPKKFWLKPTVFALGYFEEAVNDGLQISNNGDTSLDYVLIETFQNKFIVLDLRPKSNLNLEFDFDGLLSIQVRNTKGEKFVKSVERGQNLDHKVSDEYFVDISNNDISVESAKYKLKEKTSCCVIQW